MKDLKLGEIWIYPIKSLGGIRLRSARVLEKGLLHDRRWMLVDQHGEFMTQRTFPKMALFRPSIIDDMITVEKKNEKDKRVSPAFSIDSPSRGKLIRTNVWDDEVEVAEVDPELSEWFSRELEVPCRLVNFPESNPRFAGSTVRNVSLADAFPFMIIGQSSLDDLNARLQNPLPMNRFRPNFVFTGGKPFEEDTWRGFMIGNVGFEATKPCARCMLPTIDQESGEKGAEPLRTLSGYRKTGNKILFGQNLVATRPGEIFEGDTITIND